MSANEDRSENLSDAELEDVAGGVRTPDVRLWPGPRIGIDLPLPPIYLPIEIDPVPLGEVKTL